jgi:hypothetical protein
MKGMHMITFFAPRATREFWKMLFPFPKDRHKALVVLAVIFLPVWLSFTFIKAAFGLVVTLIIWTVQLLDVIFEPPYRLLARTTRRRKSAC